MNPNGRFGQLLSSRTPKNELTIPLLNPSNENSSSEKLEKLKVLLNIPPDDRTPSTIAQIAECTDDIQFLQKYRSKPEYADICRYLYIKSLDPKQYVFKQGDEGDAFYIILSGQVIIYIDEPTEYKNFMQLKEKNRLGKGAAFGEIALITNSKRTATLMANEKTELIVLEKDVFQAFIKEKKSLHLQKIQNFLQNMNLFTLLSENILLEITTKCQVKKYPSNTIIMRQGDDSAAIYFVRKGQVKAIRQIPFKYDSLLKQKVPFDVSDPLEQTSSSESNNFYYQNDFIEIDEFRDGDIFGEYSVFYSEAMEYSAISSTPCEVIYITTFDLSKIIPIENFQMYKSSLKKYPCNRDIKQIYWERKHWQEFRSQMVNEIGIEKQHKRGFARNLRKSIPRYENKEIPFNLSDIQIHDNRLYFSIMEQMCEISSKSQENTNFENLSNSYKIAAEQLVKELNSQSCSIWNTKIGRRISSTSMRPSLMYPRKSITTPTAITKQSQQQGNNDPKVNPFSKLNNSMFQNNSASSSPISNKNENRSKMGILPPLSKAITPQSNKLNISHLSMSITQHGDAIQEGEEDCN